MARTEPDVLAMLRDRGILPCYWRRQNPIRPWHRGWREGTLMVRSMCGQIVQSNGGRVIYADIFGPWPDKHCRACETATPGTDAAHEGLGVGSLTDPPRRNL